MVLQYLKKQKAHVSSGQDGAALISALLIVSVMSLTALAVIENLRFSMKLTGNLGQREQARLYALGAEQLAKSTIKATYQIGRQTKLERYPELDTLTLNPIFFPIDGGSISGSIKDGSNCFNLNSLVKIGESNTFVADEVSLQKFVVLLEAVGVHASEGQSLANSIIDWIDSNSSPGYGGAEDPDYAVLQTPYRTSGTLLADVSELNVIKGFSPELVETIARWVCVRPDVNLNQLNLNTLSIEDLPLVLSYLGNKYDEVVVSNILSQRPVTGFNEVEDFFELDVFQEDKFPEEEKQFYGLASDYYELHAQISYYQTVISLHSLLQISRGGDITLVSRRYGSF